MPGMFNGMTSGLMVDIFLIVFRTGSSRVGPAKEKRCSSESAGGKCQERNCYFVTDAGQLTSETTNNENS